MLERPLGLLSAEEVADMFGCSPQTVQRYGRAGEVPRVEMFGRWWFPRDEMVACIKAKMQPAKTSRVPNADIQRWKSGEKGVF